MLAFYGKSMLAFYGKRNKRALSFLCNCLIFLRHEIMHVEFFLRKKAIYRGKIKLQKKNPNVEKIQLCPRHNLDLGETKKSFDSMGNAFLCISLVFLRYEIMPKCWKYRPQDRPTFTELSDFLWQLEHEGSTYVNIEPLMTAPPSLPPKEGRTMFLKVSSLFIGCVLIVTFFLNYEYVYS